MRLVAAHPRRVKFPYDNGERSTSRCSNGVPLLIYTLANKETRKTMTDKPIRVELLFIANEDPTLGAIQTVTEPRPGDLVRTPHGMYQVDRILFDNGNLQMGCVRYAILSPSQYQMPSASPKVKR
jgi:hypothetical protein